MVIGTEPFKYQLAQTVGTWLTFERIDASHYEEEDGLKAPAGMWMEA